MGNERVLICKMVEGTGTLAQASLKDVSAAVVTCERPNWRALFLLFLLGVLCFWSAGQAGRNSGRSSSNNNNNNTTSGDDGGGDDDGGGGDGGVAVIFGLLFWGFAIAMYFLRKNSVQFS